MKKILLISSLLTVIVLECYAQKYLIIDRFGINRKKLSVGDNFRYRQKGLTVKYTDYIAGLGDSTVYLGEADIALNINEFDKFYFRRGGMDFLNGGAAFIGTGFLFAAAVEPLVSNNQYDARESAMIGVTSLGIATVARLFRWNKIKIGKRGRVRVVDITFR